MDSVECHELLFFDDRHFSHDEWFRRNRQYRSDLETLEVVSVNHSYDFIYNSFIKTLCYYFFCALCTFNVLIKNSIQDRIIRKTVGILLVRTQFC